MDFNCKYSEYLSFVENALAEHFYNAEESRPQIIANAMKYAVEGGGKRIRPVLLIAAGEMLNVDKEELKEFAVSVELIHSYSLVHDDLPCMDNDDYRRGKFSTHKKFGEAIGVLCGDALLSDAAETVLNKKNFTDKDAKSLKLLFEFSGSKGMIKGQVLDIEGENADNPCENDLTEIFLNKTSMLLTAPLLIASVKAGDKYYDLLKQYGFKLGLLFQIADDILDYEGEFSVIGKTPHKDENKINSIKIYGLNGAKEKVKNLYSECEDVLSQIPESDFLRQFTKYIYERKK